MRRISAIFSLTPLFVLLLIVSSHLPVSEFGPEKGRAVEPAGLQQGSPGAIWESASDPNGGIDVMAAYSSLPGPGDPASLIPVRHSIRSAESISLIGISSEPADDHHAGDSVPWPSRPAAFNQGLIPLSWESLQAGGRQIEAAPPGSPGGPPGLLPDPVIAPDPEIIPDPVPAPVPEPCALILLLTGSLTLIQARRKGR